LTVIGFSPYRADDDLMQSITIEVWYNIICIVIQFNNNDYNMFTHDVDPRAILNLLNTFAVVVVIIYNGSGVGRMAVVW
jgi:hypothetical protein